MPGSTPEAYDGAIDPSEVVEALGRVLEADPFARSVRSSGFLAFVVTETLAGRGDRLSERTVGRGAMHRGADFDGKGDATVRVQATRVRKGLDEYYAGEGADDAIRIVLPRGSYTPVFERSDIQMRESSRFPGVVVVLLTSSGDELAEMVARSMTESLVHNLAAHTHIRVVGPIDSAAGAPKSASAAGVSTILTGQVTVRDGVLSLRVRLADAQSMAVLWSTDETHPVGDLARFEYEEQWSRQIASKVGDPSGVVIRQELDRSRSTGTEPELAARLAFYSHMYRETAASLAEAIGCVDAALDTGIRTAPLLAMRGALANSSSVYESTDTDAELDRAEALAREALALDGDNAHAHLVLSWPTLVRGHTQLAVDHIETAVRLAPYQPFYLIAAGIALSASGEWERGSQLIREAHQLNPGMSSLTHGWLAMGHLVEEEYGLALAEASLLPSDDDYVWGSLVRTLALAGLGYDEAAAAEAVRLRQLRPDVMNDVGGFLGGMMRLTDAQRARLVDLLPT
jgi:TolB-like protein